jgi:hypothetical protein
MKSLYLFALIFLFYNSAKAQQDSLVNDRIPQVTKKDTLYLSNEAFHKLINRSFSKVAVGPTNGSNLANYASFEPMGGSFTFNGFTPVNARNDGSGRVSYINFAVKGGIDGNNVGALFSNSKINSNVTVSLKYHFGLLKPKITYDENAKREMSDAKDKIRSKHLAEYYQYERGIKDINSRYTEDSLKVVAINLKIAKEEQNLTNTRNTIPPSPDTSRDRKIDIGKLADSCLHLNQRINMLYNQLQAQNMVIDSLDNLRRWIQPRYIGKDVAIGHVNSMLDNIDNKFKNKKTELELNAKIDRIHFGWFSLNVDFNKQKYYTFFDTLAFDSQVSKKVLDAFNLGASYNFFWQNLETADVFYLNSGLNRLKTNNTQDLSPTEVVDTRTLTGVDTKRVITTKYNAFKNPIEEFRAWQLYMNVYYLFGKENVSGIHFFPEVNFRSTHKTVTNIGFGYVISFNDAKKAKSLINAEAYVKFADVGNVLNSERGFYKRNEIGISFGIPFNYIINASK